MPWINLQSTFCCLLLAVALATTGVATADSSSPRLAAYYDNFLALCGDQVYQWHDSDQPQAGIGGVRQVGVGRSNRYALTRTGRLLSWTDAAAAAEPVLDDLVSFHAGRSGLLAIGQDHSLWYLEVTSLLGFGETISPPPVRLADNVLTAAVGDSADYFVSRDGELFVRGRAHRGQYGDGALQSTDHFVRTATEVVQVVAHTGHALILKQDGSVWGTGGNIYGPLGRHGFGDKAVSWGRIADGMVAIATGSSHSVAIDRDNKLWIWGRDEGLEPRPILDDVSAVAASTRSTIALAQGFLWQWDRGSSPARIMRCE